MKREYEEWEKDAGRKDFDFDAFLGDDLDLDDRITSALDGKDLLEPDAFGASVPEFVPGRSGGERGRHEAPEPTEAARPVEDAPVPTPRFDSHDPRYAAPERPRVVVAEPRPKVVVSPEGGDFDPPSPPPPRRRSEGKKWLAAVLAAIVVILALLLLYLRGRDTSSPNRPTAVSAQTTPKPTEKPAETSEPTPTAAAQEATPTPAPTEPPVRTYSITVTAGTGGGVSPSGVVSAKEGESVYFSIAPQSGYVLSQLLIDGSSAPLTDGYTFDTVMENHTLYAVFSPAATEPPATPAPTPEPTPEPTSEPAPTDPPVSEPEPEPEPEPEAPAEG